MRIRVLSITHKTPLWVQEGCLEYLKRFPSTFKVELIDIPAGKRSKNADIARIMLNEGEKLLHLIPSKHVVIALDVQGKSWPTEKFTRELAHYQEQGAVIDLLIGGPDGLSSHCLDRATVCWSLSPLTFPHHLVKVIVLEQLYRAWSILARHPYHRG